MAGRAPAGGATRSWLAQSLRALGAEISHARRITDPAQGPGGQGRSRGGARERSRNSLLERGARAPISPYEKQLEAALAKHRHGKRELSPGTCSVTPRPIRNKEGHGLRVFTPFWRRCCRSAIRPSLCPRRGARACAAARRDALESSTLEPTQPDWAGGLRETWTPGEGSAARLARLLERAAQVYVADRDRAGSEATSRLSPHLRFGEISPRQVWHAARCRGGARIARGGEFPERARLARVLRSPALTSPTCRRTCSRRSMPFPGRPRRRSTPGSAADRLSDRRCRHARALATGGCTTACGWSSPRSWSSTS